MHLVRFNIQVGVFVANQNHFPITILVWWAYWNKINNKIIESGVRTPNQGNSAYVYLIGKILLELIQ